MGIIKAINLIHDYISRDAQDNEEVIRAIDGVDLEVEAGQFIAILGHNGSGKSSLAKHINALLLPTEGTMIVAGMNTTNCEDKINIRQQAGMVFQNPDNQLVASVVEEDVAFGPENLSVAQDDMWRRVNKALKDVNMTAYRYKSPDRLSGGQKQRVAIAGVMAMEPSCIILDEPTAMLDPKGREEVLAALRDLNKGKGITIILITHYMDEAIDADRVFIMDKGRILLQGEPKEVFSHVEEITAAGLEVPIATRMAYELNKKGLNIDYRIVNTEEFVDRLVEIYNNKK